MRSPNAFFTGITTALIINLTVATGTNAQDGKYDPNDSDSLPLSPEIPHDVNLSGVTSVGQARRAFDINSWQTFIALNWPFDKHGEPANTLADPGDPQWMLWKESPEVFLPDGGKPAEWGSPRQRQLPVADAPPNARFLDLTNKSAGNTNVVDEDLQAFSPYPLVDWNNEVVHYEILINKDEFDYIVTNELYNLDGQVEFAKTHHTLTFPSGSNDGNDVGAIELKLAWRTLNNEDDHPDRYLHMPAYIKGPDGSWVEREVGLVGMHIAHKTKNSPQWIWATFEHVDNLAVDELTTFDGKALKPSFYDPAQQTIPVNVPRFDPHDKTEHPKQLPTQVQRVIPIAKSTQVLTGKIQGQLDDEKSVLKYYELVGTQWPTHPTAPPTTPGQGSAPHSIANKSGGIPEPVYLTNMTLETYFQTGNQPATGLEEGNPTDETPSFGTESCIGCHSSAGFAGGFTIDASGKKKKAVFNSQLTGDFSWLPQQKAQWKTHQPK